MAVCYCSPNWLRHHSIRCLVILSRSLFLFCCILTNTEYNLIILNITGEISLLVFIFLSCSKDGHLTQFQQTSLKQVSLSGLLKIFKKKVNTAAMGLVPFALPSACLEPVWFLIPINPHTLTTLMFLSPARIMMGFLEKSKTSGQSAAYRTKYRVLWLRTSQYHFFSCICQAHYMANSPFPKHAFLGQVSSDRMIKGNKNPQKPSKKSEDSLKNARESHRP